MSEATVIVRFDTDGEISYHVLGDVRLFIVDERAPNDRVYEWLPRSTEQEIAGIIPAGEEIGNSRDERHRVLSHRIEAAQDGRPYLTVLEGAPDAG